MEEAPTSEHDTAKDSVVPVQGGAVPAVVAELVLTLSDPFSGTLAHRAHDVWVTLAQLPLPAHQTRDIVTDHSGPQCPDVPARWRWPCQSIRPFFCIRTGLRKGRLGIQTLEWCLPLSQPTFPEADDRTGPHKLRRNSSTLAEKVVVSQHRQFPCQRPK